MKGGEKLKRLLVYGFMAFGILLLVFGISNQALAGPLDCGEDCGWAIEVDGEVKANGTLSIDSEGNVELEGDSQVEGPGYTAEISKFSGQVDPELVFGVGATNSSSSAKTFSFSFSLPIALPDSPIETYASLGTTLTASSAGDGTVFPISGVGKIVDSQDIRYFPSANVDKGVDIGDALTDPAGGLPTLDAVEIFGLIEAGKGPFDLMTVVVAFGLVDTEQAAGRPGQVGVGFSGLVSQQVVPLPAAIWLLGSGLLALIGFRKKFQR